MNRKHSLIILLVAIFTLMSFVPVLAQTEINIWFGRQNFIPADNFETFHKENPDIKVNADVIPLEEALSSYVRAYRANNAPDIVQILLIDIPAFSNQGMVMDISGILDQWKEEDPANFEEMAPAAWGMASYNGVPHGMALHMAPFWYVYRKDIFEEAGIDIPETWDDAVEAGRKLRSEDMLGFTQIGIRRHVDWFYSYFLTMGGQFEDGVIQLDSDAGVYLLEFYQNMMKYDIAHPDTVAWDSGEMRAAFITGKAAQGFIGANIFSTIQKELEYGVEWEAKAPLYRPGAEDEWRIAGNGWPYVVNSRSVGKEEAIKKVLQYLSSTEIVKAVALTYQPATRMPVFDLPEYQEAQPWFKKLAESYAKQFPIPANPRTPQINQIIGDAMQDALSNPDADAKEMAAKYQAQIDEIVGN